HLRAHSHEHAEQRRAGIVQSDMADEQMTSWLRRSGGEPERRGGNIARNVEVARLGHLIAKNTDAILSILGRANEKIIKHELGVVPAGGGFIHGGLTFGEKAGE